MTEGYITIKDVSCIGPSDVTDETIMECYYKYKNASSPIAVNYTEDIADGDRCKSALTISPEGFVTMHRSGPFGTDMIFEKGARHVCNYESPAGVINIGIDTLALDYNFDKSGGKLELEYFIDCDADRFAKKKLEITVETR